MNQEGQQDQTNKFFLNNRTVMCYLVSHSFSLSNSGLMLKCLGTEYSCSCNVNGLLPPLEYLMQPIQNLSLSKNNENSYTILYFVQTGAPRTSAIATSCVLSLLHDIVS